MLLILRIKPNDKDDSLTDACIDDLCNPLIVVARKWLAECNIYFPTKIIITWRSANDQDKVKQSGLSNASSGQSPHDLLDAHGNPASRAWDFAIYDRDNNYITDGTNSKYSQAGEIAESMKDENGNSFLTWGGRWKHPDYDHIEMMNWKIS